MSITWEYFQISGYTSGAGTTGTASWTGAQIFIPLYFRISGLKYAGSTLDNNDLIYLTGSAIFTSGDLLTKPSGDFYWNEDLNIWETIITITNENDYGKYSTGFSDWSYNSGVVSVSTGFSSASGLETFRNAQSQSWERLSHTVGGVINADLEHTHVGLVSPGFTGLADLSDVAVDAGLNYTDGKVIRADGNSYEESYLYIADIPTLSDWSGDYLATSGDYVNTSGDYVNTSGDYAELSGAFPPLSGDFLTHTGLTDVHHLRYTNIEARAAIGNIFGSDGKADAHIDMDNFRINDMNNPLLPKDAVNLRSMLTGISGAVDTLVFGVMSLDDLTDVNKPLSGVIVSLNDQGSSVISGDTPHQFLWHTGSESYYRWNNYAKAWIEIGGGGNGGYSGLYFDYTKYDLHKTGWPPSPGVTGSFDNGTRTFTVTGGNWNYWINSVNYPKSQSQTTIIDDVEGSWFIYFTGNTLTGSQTPWVLEDANKALVAYLYWDADNSQEIFFNSELHCYEMDSESHTYLHHTIGTRLSQGGALGDISGDQNGNDDEDAQFSVELTILYDEDLKYTQIARIKTANIPVYYRTGADASNIWRMDDSNSFPVINVGGNRAGWNELIGSDWDVTEVDNNDFVLAHIAVTTDANRPYIAFMGQAEYNTVGLARDGAEVEINNMITEGLPMPEIRFIGTIIFQTSNGYGNTPQSRIRTTNDGYDYIDLRNQVVTRGGIGSTVTDHNLLGNLQGGTTDEYYHLTSGQLVDVKIVTGGWIGLSGDFLTVSGDFAEGGGDWLSGITTTVPWQLKTNNDTNDFLEFTTKSNIPHIVVSGGEVIRFDAEGSNQVELWLTGVGGLGYLKLIADKDNKWGMIESSGHLYIDPYDGNIYFRRGGSGRMIMSNTNFRPQTHKGMDLGSSSVYWDDLYIDGMLSSGDITVSGDILCNGSTWGAVYNDYADAWPLASGVAKIPGACYSLNDSGLLIVTNKKSDKMYFGIYSDTFGHVLGMGRNDVNKIPLSVAGYVKAKVDKTYKAGTFLTTSINGKLTKARFWNRKIAQYMKKDKRERSWVKIL